MPSRITLPLDVCICRDVNCVVPFGLCHCGCRQKTPIATVGIARIGHVKDRPIKFIRGHNGVQSRNQIDDAVPFKIDDIYCRLIPLTQGQYVIVDASDYEWLMQWNWFAKWNAGTRSYYAARQIQVEGEKWRMCYMHLEILGLKAGDSRRGDHSNNITLDCRRKNLRIATVVESMRNRRRRITNKWGYKGITKTRSGKFAAYIVVNGKNVRLGQGDTPEEGYALYCEGAKRFFGDFANLD